MAGADSVPRLARRVGGASLLAAGVLLTLLVAVSADASDLTARFSQALLGVRRSSARVYWLS